MLRSPGPVSTPVWLSMSQDVLIHHPQGIRYLSFGMLSSVVSVERFAMQTRCGVDHVLDGDP